MRRSRMVMDRFAAAGVGRWLALFVVISGLGALNGWTLLVGELTRAMALNGVMPMPLARNNRRGAPAIALVVTGTVGQRHGAAELQQVAGGGFHFPHQGRDRGQPAAVPVRVAGAGGVVAPRRARPACADAGIAVLGAAYVVFAFVGLGHEPFRCWVWCCSGGFAALYVHAGPPRRRGLKSVP